MRLGAAPSERRAGARPVLSPLGAAESFRSRPCTGCLPAPRSSLTLTRPAPPQLSGPPKDFPDRPDGRSRLPVLRHSGLSGHLRPIRWDLPAASARGPRCPGMLGFWACVPQTPAPVPPGPSAERLGSFFYLGTLHGLQELLLGDESRHFG